MKTLSKKIDFALVFSVKNCNPNGDPIDGNRPRTDYLGYGEVSDVCLKRKIRNRLLDEGESIFVQSDDRRVDEYRSLKDRADSKPHMIDVLKKINQKKATKDDYALMACKEWFDVRAFGQVFAFKPKKNTDADSDPVSIGIRGPVTIQSAISVNVVNITTMQITKTVNLETESNPDKKGKDSMGLKHRVDFGLYVTFGAINVQSAEKTGFSDEDADKLKNAMLTLFQNDETSARPAGSMEVVKLVWWTHNSKTGQYSSAKVHKLLKVEVKDGVNDIKSVDDFNIHLETLDNLSFEEYNG